MTPLENYQQLVDAGKITSDAKQLAVLKILENIYNEFKKRETKKQSLIKRMNSFLKQKKPIKGLYVWGGVGIGKTFLMDLFFDIVPAKKMRMHFHEFMQLVHTDLNNLQGHSDPLPIIAKQLAEKIEIICFDEFFVSNIADAMLLGGLFKAIFAEGITLIASSNVAPDDLYKEGIQREQFLPAIEQIKKHTHVLHLYSSKDYRLRHLQEAGVYYTPVTESAKKNMDMIFYNFKSDNNVSSEPLILFNRKIPIIKQAGKVIWFDFPDLCNVPRSQKDYLELAKHYRTILISNLPVIKASQDNLITNFINLIDVLYDAHIRVVISAEKPIEQIYTKGNMLFEFERTKSRIIEMQSEAYFYPGMAKKELTHI